MNKIISQKNMGEAWEIPAIGIYRTGKKVESLQIQWDKATGVFDSEIEIYLGNHPKYLVKARTVKINTQSNTDDNLMLAMPMQFKYLRIKYVQKSCTGGELDIFVNYVEY